MTDEAMRAAVADAPARYAEDPGRFDDHLKVFGIHDAGLRSWIVDRIANHLHDVGYESRDGDLRHWRPPSGSYVAIGKYQDPVETDTPIAVGFVRFAIVNKASLGLVIRVAYWTHSDSPVETVPFPGYGGGLTSRRARTPMASVMCPRCYTQLPATGVCDDCG